MVAGNDQAVQRSEKQIICCTARSIATYQKPLALGLFFPLLPPYVILPACSVALSQDLGGQIVALRHISNAIALLNPGPRPVG